MKKKTMGIMIQGKQKQLVFFSRLPIRNKKFEN